MLADTMLADTMLADTMLADTMLADTMLADTMLADAVTLGDAGVGQQERGERSLAQFERPEPNDAADDRIDDCAVDFVALVPLHTAAILRVASALVGSGDAEDAAQEAIVRAWQAWESLRDPGSLRPWLLRITVNVCRQWQRGGFGRRMRLVEALPEESGELLAALEASPGSSDHTGALDLRRALNELREELRVVVVLRYYAGMDATEVGDALGIPPATVRTRLKRALGLLRERMTGRGARGSGEGGHA